MTNNKFSVSEGDVRKYMASGAKSFRDAEFNLVGALVVYAVTMEDLQWSFAVKKGSKSRKDWALTVATIMGKTNNEAVRLVTGAFDCRDIQAVCDVVFQAQDLDGAVNAAVRVIKARFVTLRNFSMGKTAREVQAEREEALVRKEAEERRILDEKAARRASKLAEDIKTAKEAARRAIEKANDEERKAEGVIPASIVGEDGTKASTFPIVDKEDELAKADESYLHMVSKYRDLEDAYNAAKAYGENMRLECHSLRLRNEDLLHKLVTVEAEVTVYADKASALEKTLRQYRCEEPEVIVRKPRTKKTANG